MVTMAVLTVGAQNAHAQSNWNGGTGDWSVPGNWTPTGVPNSPTTDVSITGTSSIPSSVALDNLSPTVHNLSLDSFSTLSISAGQGLLAAGPSLSNAGQINVGNGTLYADVNGGTVTLSGGGAISLTNTNTQIRGAYGNETLVNTNNTIQGQGSISTLASFQNQGTVKANVSGGTLEINAPTTNTGTLQATGGGTLSIFATTVNNAGGTISTNSSSSVAIYDSTINGGTLDSGGSVIHATSNVFLNGVTLTAGSIYSVDPSQATLLTGDLTNKGTVNVGGAATLYADSNAGTINLTGGGTINLTASNDQIRGYYGNETLVNKDNTIQGQGSISTLASFQNQGTVNANVSGGTLSISNTQTTNSGTFQASSGSTLLVNGTLTNYNPTTSTLTGGTYNAYSGTIELSQANATAITPAVITTNAATILLDGATAKIADGSGNNILQGFLTTNATTGTLTIQNGANLIVGATSGFTNNGSLNIGSTSTLTVGGGNNFIQTSTGILSLQIGGSSPGNGYSQLVATGSANLDGTLNLSLINGFKPYNGEEFVILTSSGLSGSFSDNTIQDGNVTFTVEYSPPGYANDVVLDASVSSSVVPEPASWLMLGLGLTAVGTCVARKSKSQVRGK
jgi:hypothetical protein